MPVPFAKRVVVGVATTASMALGHALTVGLVVWLAQQPAEAPHASLDFVAAPGAEACDQRVLEDAVATRLGYRPFLADQPLTIRLDLTGRSMLTARLKVSRAGRPAGERTLSGPPDCQQLTEALALALAVVIDPLALSRPPRAVAQPAEPVVEPAPVAPQWRPAPLAASPTAPVVAIDARLPARLFLTAQGGVDLGTTPGGIVAVGLGLRFRGRASSADAIALGVAVDPFLVAPATFAFENGGSVESFALGAAGGPCVSWHGLGACAAVRVGALHSAAKGLVSSQVGWSPVLDVGPRAFFRFPFDAHAPFAVRAQVELVFHVLRSVMTVSQDAVWTQGAGSLNAVLGFEWRAL
jgi:hypothetical protein